VNLLVENPIADVDFAGFAIGNAYTDIIIDGNANVDYLYSHGIISLENFRAIQRECGREGIGCIFETHEKCSDKCLALLDESVTAAQEDRFNPYFIYGDVCLLSNNQVAALRLSGRPAANLTSTTSNQRNDIGPCADTFTQEYLNQKEVQKAIHVMNDVSWVDCSGEVGELFTSSVSALPKYPNILGKGLNVLIYSGDADSNVNFIGTERWLGEEGLKLHVTDKWKAWFGPDKQHAGYVQGYDGLTYKTIKGAGHMVPAVKPLHGLNMFECFVFGEEKCATFEYPADAEELEAGDLTDLNQQAASSSIISRSAWVPVVAVCSAVAAFVAIGAKHSKKRSSYAPIGTSA
ncbi:Serine protease family s10, partial [Globisporangium polare]